MEIYGADGWVWRSKIARAGAKKPAMQLIQNINKIKGRFLQAHLPSRALAVPQRCYARTRHNYNHNQKKIVRFAH